MPHKTAEKRREYSRMYYARHVNLKDPEKVRMRVLRNTYFNRWDWLGINGPCLACGSWEDLVLAFYGSVLS